MSRSRTMLMAALLAGNAPWPAYADHRCTNPEVRAQIGCYFPVAGAGVTSLALRNRVAYWTESPSGEFCPPGPYGRIRKIPGGGGDGTTLNDFDPDCFALPDHIEVDEIEVYTYFSSGSGIYRLWTGNVDPEHLTMEPEWLADATAPVDGLALDEHYVYWGDADGIKRVPKDRSRAAQTLVLGATLSRFGVRSLVADNGQFFWADDSGNAVSVGTFVPWLVGAVVNVLADGLNQAGNLTLDDQYLYWSGGRRAAGDDERGDILRVPRAGGPTEDVYLNGEADYRVFGLDIDNLYAYWVEKSNGAAAIDSGRIRRKAKVGGGVAASILASRFDNVHHVRVDETHIYFFAKDVWEAFTGIARVEKDAPGLHPDLRWLKIEVTQGIQDLNNNAPLVKDKPTLVRAYPTAVLADVVSVPAVLHGRRLAGGGCDAIEGSPIRSTASSMERVRRGYGLENLNRTDLDLSFNFELPSSWLCGTVELKAEINPEEGGRRTIIESDPDNNELPVTLEFEEVPPICLKLINVDTRGVSDFQRSSDGFDEIVNRMETLFPVPRVKDYDESGRIEELECWGFCFGPYENDDEDWILHKVWRRWFFGDDPDECDDDGSPVHYIGMIRAGTQGTGMKCDGDPCSGYASLANYNSWVEMDATGVISRFSDPRFGSTLAQEVGHNYYDYTIWAGNADIWAHVPCGNPDDVHNQYPYCNCQLACTAADGPCCPSDDPCGQPPCSEETFFGFDLITNTVISPTVAADYMSYGNKRWVSDWTWRNAIDAIQAEGVGANAATQQLIAGDILAVFGRIIPDPPVSIAYLDLSYRLSPGIIDANKLAKIMRSQTIHADPTSPFAVQLVNGLGDVIFHMPFRPPGTSHLTPRQDFALLVPHDPNMAGLRIMENGNPIGSLSLSANPPFVTVLEPVFGQVVDAALLVKWKSGDADGDQLFHLVQYSPDFGNTWTVLETDHPSQKRCTDTGAQCGIDADCNTTAQCIGDGTVEFTVDDIQSLSGSVGTVPGLVQCNYPFPTSLIRVLATDGLNTAMDTSDPFRVPCRPPRASIIIPQEGAVYVHSDEIILSGRGSDPEDGTLLNDSNFFWFIDPTGITVYGRTVSLPGLPPGTYHLTLYVEDSFGLLGTDTARIEVLPCRPATADFNAGQVLAHAGDQNELWASDRHPSPDNTIQFSADNFSFAETKSIAGVRWRGGYLYTTGAPPQDDFVVQFYDDASGLPGYLLWEGRPGNNVVRVLTGAVINAAGGDANEFAYEASFCRPFTALAGASYWLVIASNTSLEQDGVWGWETSLDGDGLLAFSLDDGPWSSDQGDLAFQFFPPIEPQWEGACCFTASPCAVMTATACLAAGGSYDGDLTSCPTHDYCDAQLLPMLHDGLNAHDNRCASSNGPGDDACYADPNAGSLHSELWYQYTASCTGQLTVSMCGTDGGSADYDAYIVVYGAGTATCACPSAQTPSATELACADNTCGTASASAKVTLLVAQGTCYTIAVGGWDDGTGQGNSRGTGIISLACVLPPPPGEIVWNGDPLSPDRTTRSLRFTMAPPVTATGSPGQSAVKVTMIDLQNPNPPNLPQYLPPNFGAFEYATCTAAGEMNGCARWVGKPGTFLEAQDVPLGASNRAARMQCTPFYYDWITETASGPIAVVGAEIAPSSMYIGQAYSASCKGSEPTCTNVSIPVTMLTRRSGDVDVSFNPPATTTQPDVLDVAAVVNKLKNLPGAPIKAITQLQPNLPELNADINALDVVAVVDGVKERAYAFGGPCPCPSTVTCGSMSCTTATPCVAAFGSGSLCVKTCTGPGPLAGDPCINNTHCVGSGTCGAGFCRDRCGRCTP